MQSSDEESDVESEYDFFPVKGDGSDEYTEELFEQLEEGAKSYTGLLETIRLGANLFATQISGDYAGCNPIHVAAYNIDANLKAIKQLLKSFSNAEERKRCIKLKDGTGKNVLDILIQRRQIEQDLAIPSFISVLEYLTPEEQSEILAELSEQSKEILEDSCNDHSPIVSDQEDIVYLGQFYDVYYSNGSPIEMCQQRKRELAEIHSGYDSGDDSLGSLGTVKNSKFTARISYSKVDAGNGNFESIPRLSLIPSDWRLQTAVEGSQGDHVTAYVLLLSSLSHCKGEYIKVLPDIIYNMVLKVLPDHSNDFLQKKNDVEKELRRHRKIRVEALSSLKNECDKDKQFMKHAENNLKKAEIECVARHIEEVVDDFITIINGIEGGAFVNRRKEINKSFLLSKMSSLAAMELANDYAKFCTLLQSVLTNYANQLPDNENGNLNDTLLNSIAKEILSNKWLSTSMVPKELIGSSGKITQKNLLIFLKKITPLKKYHEGHAIKAIKQYINQLSEAKNNHARKNILAGIGLECAKLFDYPKVGNPALDDEYILYQAIPRHMIIIYSAFSELRQLGATEKQIIYDKFINHILQLQLWLEHPVVNNDEKDTTLDAPLIKERILKFAVLDENHNFSMKPKAEHPAPLRVGEKDDAAPRRRVRVALPGR